MAADESEVADDKRDNDALFKKAMKLMAVAQSQINEATELLNALYEPERRAKGATDSNGEPSFCYLVKVKIPKDFRMTKKFLAYALEHKFTEESATILMHGKEGHTYEGFIKYYGRVGTKWQDWGLVWQKWVRSERERKDNKGTKGPTGQTRFSRSRTRG